ncbi:MAG: sigma-70 family RNA polymerase sigma factor [Bacteroidetes bacterium]|nr:sigma-70 family RNA polymerase sigma factor [Bacteroidota bacterium]
MSSHHKSDIEIQQELQQINAAKENSARFGVLYDKYYKSIFVFIYRRTEDEELTADITSQVFLKALINLKQYEYKGVPFSAWLFRIAFNEINMYFRKNNANRVVSLDQNGILQIAQETDLEENAEGIKQMMSALKGLEENEVQLIELRFFEKRSFAEVGAIIGITENNAKVKVYRILDKLKKVLSKK